MKIPLNWLKDFVEIPSDLKSLTHSLTMVGHMLDKTLEVGGQTVLDLELRGNRADCYSIYGIAREVAAIFGNKLREPETVGLKPIKNIGINLHVESNLVKRAMITKIKNVKILKSPKWLSDKITAYGMESINNIVDLTNYVMIELGEPMHAFDLDKIDKKLQIRLAKNGEEMITFQNEKIKLTDEDLVWATGDKVLSVAGAIGEKTHSISDTTKNILLEAANYDRANIRKSVYRHNLLTEAGVRHEKDLDPNMVEGAIGRFLYFIKKYNWGECDNQVYDYYPKKVKPWSIKLDIKQLDSMAGITINKSEINKILNNLNFGNINNISVPTHRTDVTLPEDLIEEILRIYGYDKIPVRTLSLEVPKPVTPNYIIQENKLRTDAVAVGFDETISLSFVKEKYADNNIGLLNPPNPDLKHLRKSLLENLKDAGQKIINERGELVQLFEIGKVYLKNKKSYEEKRKIGFIYKNINENNFINFKSLICSFFSKAGFKEPYFDQQSSLDNLKNAYDIYLEKELIGRGGEIDGFYFAEIDLESILEKNKKYMVNLWPKYPPQIEDITFEVPEKVYIGDIAKTINQFADRVELKDIFKNKYTFNIEYINSKKTLTDKEVALIRNKIIKKVKEKFGVTV